MILRKPYAFIIKNFRIIHLILLGCLLFSAFQMSDLYSFFSHLQSTGTYIYVDAIRYINTSAFYAIGINLFLSLVIYWLLKIKKKNVTLYLLLIIYNILLIFAFIYLNSQLRLLTKEIFTIDKIILVKDISFISNIPAYVFAVFCFIRGIGFNIKQFNFSRDIQELKIVEKDSDEFEFVLGQNNYKYLRTMRRVKREMVYYIKENKFAITVFSIIILVICGGIGYYYYDKYEKKMALSEITYVDNITYSVSGAYVTEYDYNYNLINKGYKYVIVDLDLFTNATNRKLNLERIILNYDEFDYHPTLSKNGKFYDLGIPYLRDSILPVNENYSVSLVFEIPSTVKTNNFTLKVQYETDDSFSSKVVNRYRNFNVKAINVDQAKEPVVYHLNESISSNIVDHNKFELLIKNYDIKDNFNNRYIKCITPNDCSVISKLISSNKDASKTMLILDYEGFIDNDAFFSKHFNTYDKIFENFIEVNFITNGKSYKEKAVLLAADDADGKAFILVDRKIKNASSIYLMFKFRNEWIKLIIK